MIYPSERKNSSLHPIEQKYLSPSRSQIIFSTPHTTQEKSRKIAYGANHLRIVYKHYTLLYIRQSG